MPLKTAIETKARTLAEALEGADVFYGLSVKGALTPEMLKGMAKDPIVFAMANPDPEISPEEALAARPDESLERLKGLYAGLRKVARKFGVAIVGGETSRSPGPLFLNVALTGRVEPKHCVLRSGGRDQ